MEIKTRSFFVLRHEQQNSGGRNSIASLVLVMFKVVGPGTEDALHGCTASCCLVQFFELAESIYSTYPLDSGGNLASLGHVFQICLKAAGTSMKKSFSESCLLVASE